MADSNPDPADIQPGLGLAAFLIVSTLLDKLADYGVITRDQLSEILTHARSNATANQFGSPIAGVHAAAVKAIDVSLAVSKAKASGRQIPR
jgi:hypothetical protein